jgi:hypothetical protein
MRTAFWVSVWISVIASICCSSSSGPAVQGELAPEFRFKDQSGKELSLSQLRGKGRTRQLLGHLLPALH